MIDSSKVVVIRNVMTITIIPYQQAKGSNPRCQPVGPLLFAPEVGAALIMAEFPTDERRLGAFESHGKPYRKRLSDERLCFLCYAGRHDVYQPERVDDQRAAVRCGGGRRRHYSGFYRAGNCCCVSYHDLHWSRNDSCQQPQTGEEKRMTTPLILSLVAGAIFITMGIVAVIIDRRDERRNKRRKRDLAAKE